MALNVGDTYTLRSEIATGSAPGQSQYKAGAGSQLKIKGTRNVGGQLYYDIDQTAFGGGTGWTAASALEGAVQAPASAPIDQLTGADSPLNQTLKDYQSNLFQNATSPEVRVPTMDELKKEVAPSTPRPEPLKRVEQFDKLRTEYGVSDLETSLNDLKSEQAQLEAEFRAQRVNEQGKPVPLNVIQGRIGEEERQYLERQDYLGRQIARTTDQLNTKYSIINTYMNLHNLDYQDAVQSYESEYNRNLQMYNIISGEKSQVLTQRQADQAAARANLQTIVNLAISGNVSVDSLSGDQKSLINKLEVVSGLPMGFISSLKPKQEIVFTTKNESTGLVQIGLRNADGSIKLQSVQTAPTSTNDKIALGGGGWEIASQSNSKTPSIQDLWPK